MICRRPFIMRCLAAHRPHTVMLPVQEFAGQTLLGELYDPSNGRKVGVRMAYQQEPLSQAAAGTLPKMFTWVQHADGFERSPVAAALGSAGKGTTKCSCR
jgi:hypothetical protein